MNNVLLLGSNGNLGAQLKQLLPDAIGWDRSDIDVTDYTALKEKIAALPNKPQVIINCIAFNDLDAAETNPDIAYLLNRDVPQQLSGLANELDATLVHFSTGYVFSGGLKPIHDENDQPDPNSVYAESKLAGEQAIKNTAKKYYIVRTNVLFGPQGPSEASKKSVVDVMRDIGMEKKMLKGITDEQSNFTYTPELAQATIDLITEAPEFGLYHIINEGHGSWYDLSAEIFKAMGWNVLEEGDVESLPEKTIVIAKITGDQYPRPAKRPVSAVLINTKRPKLRSWQDALADYLNSSFTN